MYKLLALRRLTSFIFSKLPHSLLEEISNVRLIIPYYHLVSDNKVIHVKHLYSYKNISQFKSDVDYLSKNYHSITLHDVLDCLKTKQQLPSRSVLLTFDDGLREMYDIVAPILLKKGVHATFFISTEFIDNKRLCFQHKASIVADHILQSKIYKYDEYVKNKLATDHNVKCINGVQGILSINYHQRRVIDAIAELLNIDFNEYLSVEKPYLTTDNIKKLIEYGFTVGAHSTDHPWYALLSVEDQLRQTLDSVKDLRKRFDLQYGAYAFPHNDYKVTKEYFERVQQSGLVDISFGTSGMLRDIVPGNIQRISMEKPLRPAAELIALKFAMKIYKQVLGKDVILR